MESFKVPLAFPEEWFCIRRIQLLMPNLASKRLEPIFHGIQNKNTEKFNMGKSSSEKVCFKVCNVFPENLFCIR